MGWAQLKYKYKNKKLLDGNINYYKSSHIINQGHANVGTKTSLSLRHVQRNEHKHPPG